MRQGAEGEPRSPHRYRCGTAERGSLRHSEFSRVSARPLTAVQLAVRPEIMTTREILRDTWIQDLLCLDDTEELEGIVFRGDTVLYDHLGVYVSTKDLACMQPGRPVHDGPVNLFGTLLNEQLEGICYVYSTQWTGILDESDFTSNMRFPRVIGGEVRERGMVLPASVKYVFFPFHKNFHWKLVVADMAGGELVLCDSLLDHGEAIPNWVAAVGTCLTAQRPEWGPWRCRNGRVPRQANGGMDCALAVVYNISRVLEWGTSEDAFTYPPDHLRRFRQKIKVMMLYDCLAPSDRQLVQTVRRFQLQLEGPEVQGRPQRQHAAPLATVERAMQRPACTGIWHLPGDKKRALGFGPSTIPGAGTGLFACRPFKAGAIIDYYGGKEMSAEEATRSDSKYLLTNPATGMVIDAQDISSGYAGRANDCLDIDRENSTFCVHRRRLCLKASRDLDAEEIFSSYGDGYWFVEEYFHMRLQILTRHAPDSGWETGLGSGWWSERGYQLHGYTAGATLPDVCTHDDCQEACERIRRSMDGRRKRHKPPPEIWTPRIANGAVVDRNFLCLHSVVIDVGLDVGLAGDASGIG